MCVRARAAGGCGSLVWKQLLFLIESLAQRCRSCEDSVQRDNDTRPTGRGGVTPAAAAAKLSEPPPSGEDAEKVISPVCGVVS